MERAHVALISMGRHFFDTEHAEKMLDESEQSLSRNLARSGVNVRRIGRPITSPEDAAHIRAEMAEHGEPDLIVVQYGTFGLWSHLEQAIGGVTCPVIVWIIPEPGDAPGRLRLNSMCGANLGSNYLFMRKRWFRAVYGSIHSRHVLSTIETVSKAAYAVRQLKGSRIGVIGDPPTGFYPWDFSDSHVKERFGVELVRIPLDRLIGPSFPETQDIRRSHLAEEAMAMQNISTLDQDEIERSIGLAIAMHRVVEEDGLNAVAIRCWPEIPEQMSCAACFGVSALAGSGIPTACEADVYGALSLLCISYLAGGDSAPALMDLVSVDDSTAVFWHCGAAPLCYTRGQHPGRNGVCATVHPNRKVALALDFDFTMQTATCCRVGIGRDGRDRAVVFSGKRAEMPRHFTGTSCALNVGRSASDLVESLLNAGYEHHYAIAPGAVENEFSYFCDMLELPLHRP